MKKFLQQIFKDIMTMNFITILLYNRYVCDRSFFKCDEFNEEDRGRVLEVIKRSTFNDKLSELENGIETLFTRGFDEKGTNFSGGEDQKLAIARVFAGNYDLITLMSRLHRLILSRNMSLINRLLNLLLIKLLYLCRIVCQPRVMPIVFIYLRTAG